ncbi:flagellar basal body L-ring protein FlgH [Pyruvatibacter sp.]|uniref:flagellar basal body L-ring protein FlgH n=1 Tax=Pyruvatibacter sp. TaxID=1981328 RepID=UPI0032EF0FD4
MTLTYRSVFRLAAISGLALSLVACNAADRLQNIGKAPDLTPIQNPASRAEVQTVSLPMPEPETVSYQPNSLWRAGSRAFFRDQRASTVGDILTVTIEITDKAEIENTTERSRSNSEDAGLNNLFGYAQNLDRFLPDQVDNANLVGLDSTSASRGAGSVDREETVNLTVAAIVTQILPNGNLVIQGKQEVRVNYEVRELLVAGVIRPEDISNQNTINHTQIAEARISYGGRGQITDVQQPRYGQQVFDIIMPF